MMWKYKCISCKKTGSSIPKSIASWLEKKKKLDSSYDRKKRIAYCICVKCLKKGKILGDFFDEYRFKGMEKAKKGLIRSMNKKSGNSG
ncbi:MAG: hypothetical protein V1870_05580 [Candidatus Aenigmatarchaeota archaeon]